MQYSTNYSFKLPQATDPANIGDINYNFEWIDANLVDATLTVANKAAEAKNTGDRLNKLTGEAFPVDRFPNAQMVSSWSYGAISQSTGENSGTSTSYVRTGTYHPSTRFHLALVGVYDIRVFRYTANGSGFVDCTPWTDGAVGLDVDPYTDSGTYYRYSVAKKDRTAISSTELTYIKDNFKGWAAADTTLSLRGYAADAKAVSEMRDEISAEIAHRITSLDEIAWGGKSYRDIFVTGDLLHGEGRFESGNLDGWAATQGEPTLITEGGGHVMECVSDGSSVRVQSGTFTVPATGRRQMFAACRVNVLSVTSAGNRGFGIVDRNGEGSDGLTFAKGLVTTVTDGYVTVGGRYAYNTGITTGYEDRLLIGNYTQSSESSPIVGTATYNNAVWINLYNVFGSTVPSEATMLELYNRYSDYLDRRKAGESDGLSATAKAALLALLQDIPYASPSAQAHYTALVNALGV